MTLNKIIVAAALVAGATLGVSSAALAQSAYTTGTIASSERAGYPSPSPEGYGSGLYAYAPGFAYGHAATERQGVRVRQSRTVVEH
jgi:hypothetical protein